MVKNCIDVVNMVVKMENGDMVKKLQDIYLSPYEANAYLALLYHDNLTAKDLASVTSIPKQRTNDVLSTLENKGMAISHPGPARLFKPVIPEIALNQIIEKKERLYEEEVRKKYDLAKELTMDLSQIIAAKDKDLPATEYIWTIKNNIGAVYAKSVMASQKYIYELMKEPYSELEPQSCAYLDALARKVDVRFIIEKSPKPEIRAFLDALVKKGAKIKQINHVPAKLGILDDNEVWMALVSPNHIDNSFMALVIKHPTTASLEKQYFERVWAEGENYR